MKKLKVAQLCPTLCNPHGLYSSWNSPGQNPRVTSLSLLQGIVPTQGSNTGLLHCRRILYQLSHKESLRTLCWVAYPFSSRSFQPRDRTQVYRIAGEFSYQLSHKYHPSISTFWCISKELKHRFSNTYTGICKAALVTIIQK